MPSERVRERRAIARPARAGAAQPIFVSASRPARRWPRWTRLVARLARGGRGR